MRSRSIARLGVMLAAVVLAGISLRAADEPEKLEGDWKTLQGKWTAPSESGDTVTYTFNGKKLKVVAPTRSYEMTVAIDEAAKPEKTIDFTIDKSPADAKGKTVKGIYRFDSKDRLVWSFRPEGERPSTYEQIGYEQILTEMTRVKDKDKD